MPFCTISEFETGWSWSIAVVCLIWELLAVIPVVFSRLSDEYGYDDMFWVYPPDFVLRAEKKNIFYKFCASFCLRLRFNHGEPKEEEPLVSECARSMPELVDRRAQSTSFEFAAHPDLELNDAQPDVNDAKEIEESQGMGDKYKILPDAEKCDEVVEPEEKEECDGDFEEVLLVHKPDEVEEENKEEDERKSLFEEKEALETGSVDLTDTKDLYPPESPHDLKEPTESPRDLHEDPQEVAPSENEFEEHVMETANDYNDEREDDPFVDEPEIVTEENDAASVKSGNDLDEDNDPVYESDFEDEDPDDDIEAKNEPEPEEPEPELTFTFEPSNSFKGKKGKVVKKKGKGIKRKGSKKKKKVRRSTSGAQQPEIAKKKPRAKTAKTPSEVKRNSKPDVSEPFTLTVKPASYFWQRITRSIVNDFRQSRKNAALENPDGMDVQDHDDRLFDRPARYNVPNNEQDDDDNGASARQRSKTMPDIHVDMTDGDTEGAAGVDYDALMYETYHDEQDLAPKHAEAVDVSDEKQGTGSGYRPRKLKPAWTNLLDSFKSQAVNAELSKPGNKAQTKAYSKKKQTQQLPVPNEERERKISIFSTGSSIPAIDI